MINYANHLENGRTVQNWCYFRHNFSHPSWNQSSRHFLTMQNINSKGYGEGFGIGIRPFPLLKSPKLRSFGTKITKINKRFEWFHMLRNRSVSPFIILCIWNFSKKICELTYRVLVFMYRNTYHIGFLLYRPGFSVFACISHCPNKKNGWMKYYKK